MRENTHKYFITILILFVITLQSQVSCVNLYTAVDKFDGSVKIEMPMTYTTSESPSPEQRNIIFSKKITCKDTSYFVYLSIQKSVPRFKGNGVGFVFSDGYEINKGEAQTGWRFEFIIAQNIKLTKSDIEYLLTHKLTWIRIYTYDQEIKDQEDCVEYLKCLLK